MAPVLSVSVLVRVMYTPCKLLAWSLFHQCYFIEYVTVYGCDALHGLYQYLPRLISHCTPTKTIIVICVGFCAVLSKYKQISHLSPPLVLPLSLTSPLGGQISVELERAPSPLFFFSRPNVTHLLSIRSSVLCKVEWHGTNVPMFWPTCQWTRRSYCPCTCPSNVPATVHTDKYRCKKYSG